MAASDDNKAADVNNSEKLMIKFVEFVPKRQKYVEVLWCEHQCHFFAETSC